MSLLAWYPFNGNGEDHSVNRNTISFTSGAYSSSGRTGKCISAGSSKTVTVSGLSGTIDFTLAFWVYPKSANITANWTRVISLSDGGNTVRMEVCSDDSRPRYGIYNNSGNVIFPTAFNPYYGDKSTYYDSWHHIVVTRNAKNAEFYLDGSLVSSVTPSATGTLTGELFMNPTVANLSDVRVYNKRISKKEVMDLYRAKFLDINFEDVPSSFVPDVSGQWNKFSRSSGFTTVADTELGTYAGSFNGGSYIYRSSIFAGRGANAPFTVLFSFNSSKIGNTQGIICDRSTTGGPFTIFVLSSKFRIDFNSQHTVNYTFSSNTWYHCAVTFSGSQAKTYVNGTLVDTWSATMPNCGTVTAIGASHSNGAGYENYFVGKITDIVVFGSCLSADEVKHFYHSRLKFTKTSGIDFYRIEEDEDNTSNGREIFSSNMVAKVSAITEDTTATKVQIFNTAAVKTTNVETGSASFADTTVNGKLGVESLTLGSAAEKGVDTTISSATSVNIPTSAAVKTYIDNYIANNLK